MLAIYKKVESVVVWLGEHSDHTKLFLTTLHWIARLRTPCIKFLVPSMQDV